MLLPCVKTAKVHKVSIVPSVSYLTKEKLFIQHSLTTKITSKLLNKNRKYQCNNTILFEVLTLLSCAFCTPKNQLNINLDTERKEGILT